MNARTPPRTAATTATAAVFTSGNSQAIRLPKEFRFDTKQVTIERRGDEIVLRAKKQTVGDLLRNLPPLTEQECAEWEHAMSLIDDAPAQERDWNALLGNK
ncbi:MAG: antidote-toxin recognition MazE family protein [Polaromonas sp.]|nr:antidote-toxin recognition MazE family protein [Polaromonas sp.]